MFKRLCLTVAALTLVVGLSGCSEPKANKADLIAALQDDGLTEEEAKCIADALYDEFEGNDDALKSITDSDTAEDLSPAVRETVEQVIEDCTSG